MMLWCRNCQHENDQEAVFCSYCGQLMAAELTAPPIIPSTGATIKLKRPFAPVEQSHTIPELPSISQLPKIRTSQPTHQDQDFLKILGIVFIGLFIAAGVFNVLAAGVSFILHVLPIICLGGIVALRLSPSLRRNNLFRWMLAIATLIAIPQIGWLLFIPILLIGNPHYGWVSVKR